MQVIRDTRLFVGNRGFNVTFSVMIPKFLVKSHALAGCIGPTERETAFVTVKEVLFGVFLLLWGVCLFVCLGC